MNHKQMHRKRGIKNKFIFVAMIVLIVLAGVYAYYSDFGDIAGEASGTGSSGTTTSSPTTTFENVDLSKTKMEDIQIGWKVNGKVVTAKTPGKLGSVDTIRLTFDDGTKQTLRKDIL